MKLSAILSLLSLSGSLACNHEAMAYQAETNKTLPFTFTAGNDGPADPATKSYFINHVALMVSDIDRSREWYSTVLGMRHAFSLEFSPQFSVCYMAHSQAGRSGNGYQTGAELNRDKNNLAGMVELQQYIGSTDRSLDTASPRLTFSHMGLIVEDTLATQTRFESLGVRILKRVGEADFSGDTEESRIVGGAWGFWNMKTAQTQEDLAKILPGLEGSGFKDFLIVADPDGNLFEVQPFVAAAS